MFSQDSDSGFGIRDSLKNFRFGFMRLVASMLTDSDRPESTESPNLKIRRTLIIKYYLNFSHNLTRYVEIFSIRLSEVV